MNSKSCFHLLFKLHWDLTSLNTNMKIYEDLLTTHNMVLFQGGLGGNFVSYLISIHSLNLPLGNPSVGLAYNEYSMAIACVSADDPYCNSYQNKSYILE